jgi:hypothetical protein
MANSKYETSITRIPFDHATNTWDSRFEYVKQFEQPDNLLPNTWVVVRIDGRGFTKYDFYTPLCIVDWIT